MIHGKKSISLYWLNDANENCEKAEDEYLVEYENHMQYRYTKKM